MLFACNLRVLLLSRLSKYHELDSESRAKVTQASMVNVSISEGSEYRKTSTSPVSGDYDL
jgi:hypothetical protein